MTKKEVVRRAKNFCNKYSIKSYPVDIIKLCNQVGLKVFEEYLPAEVSGFIIIQNDSIPKYGINKVVVVNLQDSPTRRRFTIAHELAHFVLHRDESELLYAHRDAGQNNYIEQEANLFASNILMPEELVKAELSKCQHQYFGNIPNHIKTKYIANVFAVSESAAAVRLSLLNVG